jgi:phage terminase large subunit GpA-like protein
VDLSIEGLRTDLERLAAGEYLADPVPIALDAIELLTPPELISTTECAARYRYIPNPEGTEASLWSATLTPYINGIQDALDDPEVGLVIVPKPGRVGGTMAAENHLFKRMKFGPITDVLWYLPSDSEVDSYADRTVSKLFELHPDLQAKIGKRRSDDKLKRKRVSGRLIEWLQLNRRTITGRTGGFIAGDEIDAANPKLRSSFVDQMKVRGTTLGSRFKGYLCSHMDAGWTSGIAPAWKESSRGIWYWPCPHCSRFSSPCPTAPKGWRMILDYERPSGVSDDEMLDRVEATAGLKCPHCGDKAADVHKAAMLAAGVWVHEGQTIAEDGTVTGEPRSKKVMGFWIHGTMSPWVSIGDLARRYVSALKHFEDTRRPERLREVTAKVLGEVYEGGGSQGRAVDPVKLMERCAAVPERERFEAGTFPRAAGARFATAAVDVGGSKFDVQVEAWDLENRNWKVERFTLRQRRLPDGRMVDLRPGERQEDWIVLRDEVLRRLIPVDDDPDLGMPIAGVAIDTGGVEGVTWKAREFARRMARAGESGRKGYRIRLIKGGTSKVAPDVSKPREINKDDEGKTVAPAVKEWTLNVDKLKALVVERLAIEEDGPGYVGFADGLPRSLYDELAGEVLIDGKWERHGANEALDLSGYNEAVRILLQPERADIKWDTRPPVWARPVALNDEDEDEPASVSPLVAAAANQKMSPVDRLAALNRR